MLAISEAQAYSADNFVHFCRNNATTAAEIDQKWADVSSGQSEVQSDEARTYLLFLVEAILPPGRLPEESVEAILDNAMQNTDFMLSKDAFGVIATRVARGTRLATHLTA